MSVLGGWPVKKLQVMGHGNSLDAIRHPNSIHGIHVVHDVDDHACLDCCDGGLLTCLQLPQSPRFGKEPIPEAVRIPVLQTI